MRVACQITKATNTHSEYAICSVFHGKNGTNAPHFYVIRALSVFLCPDPSCTWGRNVKGTRKLRSIVRGTQVEQGGAVTLSRCQLLTHAHYGGHPCWNTGTKASRAKERDWETTWRSCRVSLLGKGVFTHKGRKFCLRMKLFVVLLVLTQIVFGLGKSLMDVWWSITLCMSCDFLG